ncbi:MAG TPA: DUF4162 domain-containing protein, partial [Coriobacteriia bacterium]|nr:DUF4162 domain-containing protein [Coriobacteriia bacterium]
ELKARYAAHRLELKVVGDAMPLVAALEAAPWTTAVTAENAGSISIAVADLGEARREVPRMIADLGLGLDRLESGEISLEDVFVELVGGRS